MKQTIILLLFLLLIPMDSEATTMKLLAVSEDKDGIFKGSIADLELKIENGNGKVFIDTYPYSKIDTQISSRFAKEIACDFLDRNCNQYNFFYNIKADSSIIGGPSGSAAIAALTIIVLDDLNFNPNVAITGTINSGGFIGPVSGIKEKIEAASKSNLKKVLIPIGTSNQNQSINLIDYGEELGIKVIEVKDLNEIILEFANIKYPNEEIIKVDQSYSKTMESLAHSLCNKSKYLRNEIIKYDISILNKFDTNLSKLEEANNLTIKGLDAKKTSNFYSSASFCFGANVKFQELVTQINNNSNISQLKSEIQVFEDLIEQKGYKTITDLQAYMVIKERINDARENLLLASSKQKLNVSYYREFAYAKERLYSAKSWSKFLTHEGKEFNFKKSVLHESCIQKLAEAEERYQYLNLFLPNSENVRKDLEKAKEDLKNENFELCLFRGSKAKAQINSILNFIGVRNVSQLITNKFSVIELNIAKKINKNIFPIVGYSYLEYAKALADDGDFYSSILYGEYALELSDLELYFKPKESEIRLYLPNEVIFVGIGIILGFIIGIFFKRNKK